MSIIRKLAPIAGASLILIGLASGASAYQCKRLNVTGVSVGTAQAAAAAGARANWTEQGQVVLRPLLVGVEHRQEPEADLHSRRQRHFRLHRQGEALQLRRAVALDRESAGTDRRRLRNGTAQMARLRPRLFLWATETGSPSLPAPGR